MQEGILGFLLSHPGFDPRLAAFLFLLLFGFALPIPEELALVLTGAALRSAGLPFLEAAALAFPALALADIIYYSVARLLGPRLLRIRLLRRVLNPARIEATELYFARKGPGLVFAFRFVIGLRLAGILGSGFLRMPIGRFLAYNCSALLVGLSGWLAVGYSIGSRAAGELGPALGQVLSICAPVAATVASILVYGNVMAERARLAMAEGVSAPR